MLTSQIHCCSSYLEADLKARLDALRNNQRAEHKRLYEASRLRDTAKKSGIILKILADLGLTEKEWQNNALYFKNNLQLSHEITEFMTSLTQKQ
jgi:hypothetical protein